MLEIPGQELLREQLERSVRTGRVAHANLISGPSGAGKTNLALEIAQALNCTADLVPCGSCNQCQRIVTAKHTDVRLIGEAGHGVSIDEIRELQQDATLVPFEGRNRVFVIIDAERMSGEAANSLLKTLEEPPANVYLILLTSNPAALLSTVRSRCRLIEIRPLSPKLIQTYLEEKHGVDPKLAGLISRLSEGRLGWALEAVANPHLIQDRGEQLDSILDLMSMDYSGRLVRSGELTDRYARNKQSLIEWITLMRQWWRDVLLRKSGRTGQEVNIDRSDQIQLFAETCSIIEAGAAVRDIGATIQRLGQNANARLALDVLFLELPQLSTTTTASAVGLEG